MTGSTMDQIALFFFFFPRDFAKGVLASENDLERGEGGNDE